MIFLKSALPHAAYALGYDALSISHVETLTFAWTRAPKDISLRAGPGGCECSSEYWSMHVIEGQVVDLRI